MNVVTLSREKVEYETGALPIALYPSNLSKEDENSKSYFARVICRGNFNMETIAADLQTSGSKHSKEELLDCWNEINAAIMERLVNGATVDTGILTLSLGIKGLFSSESAVFDRKNNGIDINAHSTSYTKEILSGLDCKVSVGNRTEPFILSVSDSSSKTENSFATRGGIITIKGYNIKIFGSHENVGLYFVSENEPENEIKVEEKRIGMSKSKLVQCIVPDSLNVNERYRIKIVTQFMRTSEERMTPQSCVSNDLLTVI